MTSAPSIDDTATQLTFTPIADDALRRAGARLLLWRLDQIPGAVSGNKTFKLSPGIAEALDRGSSGLASFGGIWSNHLHTLAAAGKAQGFKTLGIVRGDDREKAEGLPSAMLADAQSWGMQLHFVSRSDYRCRHDAEFVSHLQAQYPDYHWLPEGGSNLAGIRGCAALGRALADKLETGDLIALPCGTGGTLAGLRSGLASDDAELVGYSVLKGADFLEGDIRRWSAEAKASAFAPRWKVEHRFHGGGYGKCHRELKAFIVDFYRRHRVALDPVYSGKMLWGIYQQLAAGELDGRRIVALHTGGLQGLRGYPDLLAEMTQMGFQGLQQRF